MSGLIINPYVFGGVTYDDTAIAMSGVDYQFLDLTGFGDVEVDDFIIVHRLRVDNTALPAIAASNLNHSGATGTFVAGAINVGGIFETTGTDTSYRTQTFTCTGAGTLYSNANSGLSNSVQSIVVIRGLTYNQYKVVNSNISNDTAFDATYDSTPTGLCIGIALAGGTSQSVAATLDAGWTEVHDGNAGPNTSAVVGWGEAQSNFGGDWAATNATNFGGDSCAIFEFV